MTPPARRLKKRYMSGDITDSIPATYPATAEAREALRRTSKRLSDTQQMRYPAQGDAMAALPTDERCTASTDTINDFAVGTTRRLQNPKLLPALWLVIATHHPDTLAKALRDVRIEKLIGSDPLTNALHDFLLPGSALNRDRLAELQGHYAAFVPFYLNDGEVALMALECGVGENPGAFVLAMHYQDLAKRDRRDRIEGRIIPCGENVLFVGQIAGQQTPYIFALSRIAVADGRVDGAEGVVLVGARRGERPSGYPIVILNNDSAVQPRVISAEAAATEIPEWAAIAPVFARGNVRWQ